LQPLPRRHVFSLTFAVANCRTPQSLAGAERRVEPPRTSARARGERWHERSARPLIRGA
jgi:hypothetical protein